MRVQTFLVGAGLSALILSQAVSAQTAEKYRVLSRQFVSEAGAALSDNKIDEAQYLYERALVANPANITAMVGLGQAYEEQNKTVRGLKYYRQALEIEPNNLNALEAQSLAFLKQDLPDAANANLGKLERLCKLGCASLNRVKEAYENYKATQDSTNAAGE